MCPLLNELENEKEEVSEVLLLIVRCASLPKLSLTTVMQFMSF